MKQFRNLSLIFSLTLQFCTNGLFSQTAEEIIAKHIEAIGGEKALNNINSIISKQETETFTKMQQREVVYSGEQFIFLKSPNKYRTETKHMGHFTIQAFNGETGWTIPFKSNTPEKMTDEMIEILKNNCDIRGDFYNYKEKGYTIAYKGTGRLIKPGFYLFDKKLINTEVFKIDLISKNGIVVKYEIDAKTYLIVKRTVKIEIPETNQEFEYDTYFLDYRTIEGCQFSFFQVTGYEKTYTGKANVISLEVNVNIDDSIFNIPK